jgi:ribosomal protein S18 acetylase RimI-like enzyme
MSIEIRKASHNEIPFLVQTIIDAEKSGTNILPYEKIFGLSESETREMLTEILLLNEPNCELSLDAFLVAFLNNKPVGAVSAWIEALEGVSSSVIKGNLLRPYLSVKNLMQANNYWQSLQEVHFDISALKIQIGLVYVAEEARGNRLAEVLIKNQLQLLSRNINQSTCDVYIQVYQNNESAIKAYSRVGFEIIETKVNADQNLIGILPDYKKVLMQLKYKQHE